MSEQDPNEPDWSEVVGLMREARSRSRGYADYWEWKIDKPRAERKVARVLRNFLVAAGEDLSGDLASITSDPPDVLLRTVDNRRIGIEVTELVNEKVVKRNHKRRMDQDPTVDEWALWDASGVAEALNDKVLKKDQKMLRVQIGAYDELILAICTDEPLIDEALARAAVVLAGTKTKSINRAYLILSYQPQSDTTVHPDGCPVLQINLQPSMEDERTFK